MPPRTGTINTYTHTISVPLFYVANLKAIVSARLAFGVVRVAVVVAEEGHRERPDAQLARLAADGVDAHAVLRREREWGVPAKMRI